MQDGGMVVILVYLKIEKCTSLWFILLFQMKHFIQLSDQKHVCRQLYRCLAEEDALFDLIFQQL